MAEDDQSSDTSLFPSSDGDKENSGLQDILAVAARIKENKQNSSDPSPADSGVIVFTAGEGDGESSELDEDALFSSFSGGLSAGLSVEAPLLALDDESEPATVVPAAVEPEKKKEGRGPLVVVALLLGVLLIGGAVWAMRSGGEEDGRELQAKASAGAEDPNSELAVGDGAEAGADDPAEAAEVGAEPVEAELDTGESGTETGAETGDTGETETAGETGLLDGELLASADDPMANPEGLFEGGEAKAPGQGKWEQGKPKGSKPKPDNKPKPDPSPDPAPDLTPDPIVDPLPDPKPSGGGKEDDVDCLLNPDLAKCQSNSGTTKPDDKVLAPKLPEKLGSAELKKGFSKIKTKAKACGASNGAAPGTKVKVRVSIEGASGKVTKVEVKGDAAGTPLGKCIEGVVKAAVFDPFKKPAMGLDYSLMM